MKRKNFLEKLRNGAGVEWKTLGAVGSFIRGSGISKGGEIMEPQINPSTDSGHRTNKHELKTKSIGVHSWLKKKEVFCV